MTQHRLILATGFMAAGALFIASAPAFATRAASPSGSLVVRMLGRQGTPQGRSPHALLDTSMFAISPPELRIFEKHDLIQIIVREASRAESDHERETEKGYRLRGEIAAWPDFRIEDLLNLQIYAGRTTDLPKLDMTVAKEFEGDGEYSREDEFTTRLSAEVIDILPNGNLILEARTKIKMDREESTIKVTGVCRPIDITAANTVLSSQIHDLNVEKFNTGDLKEATDKGIIARILDTIFAF